MALAGALLMVPIVALMWVPSYAKIDPELFGFPFFFWYQFLWVFLCSALTYTAYRLTLAARPPRTPGTTSTTDRTDGTGGTDGSGGSHTPDGDR
jgi:cell wall-associated NlpC family hydrolase